MGTIGVGDTVTREAVEAAGGIDAVRASLLSRGLGLVEFGTGYRVNVHARFILDRVAAHAARLAR